MSRSPTLMNQCYWSPEMCLVLQLVWHTNDPSLLNEHKRLVKVRISLVFRRFLLFARQRERVWSDLYFIPVISRGRLQKWRIPCFVFLRLPLSRRCTTMCHNSRYLSWKVNFRFKLFSCILHNNIKTTKAL